MGFCLESNPWLDIFYIVKMMQINFLLESQLVEDEYIFKIFILQIPLEHVHENKMQGT